MYRRRGSPSSRRLPLPALASLATRFLALAFVLLALAGCDQRWEWNQKLIVTVETPDGLRTGEAVVGVRITRPPEWLAQGEFARINGFFNGEATVVDLGTGRFLFTLLAVEYTRAYATFGDVPPGDDKPLEWFGVIETLRERRPLPREAWPRFVTFDDVTDPATVRQVNPDNLEPRFGPGYRIASVELELTGEPVTRGRVEAVLPWLGPYPEPAILPNVHPKDFSFAAKLRHGHFQQVGRDER